MWLSMLREWIRKQKAGRNLLGFFFLENYRQLWSSPLLSYWTVKVVSCFLQVNLNIQLSSLQRTRWNNVQMSLHLSREIYKVLNPRRSRTSSRKNYRMKIQVMRYNTALLALVRNNKVYSLFQSSGLAYETEKSETDRNADWGRQDSDWSSEM